MPKLIEKKHNWNEKRLIIADRDSLRLFPPGDDESTVIVTSREELRHLLRSKFSFQEILIYVELDWNEEDLFHGYAVALELLESPNRTQKFNLAFFSLSERKVIHKNNTGTLQIFTQCFPHYKPSPHTPLSSIPIKACSERKFNYLRKYSLTQSGILDRLEHDMRQVEQLSDNQVDSLIRRLKSNADIIGPQALQYVHGCNTARFKSRAGIIHKALIERIRTQQTATESEQDSRLNDRENWKPKVVLVEDKPVQLEQLKEKLEPYFKLYCFHKGSATIEFLKTDGKIINAIICDMELLDEDTEFCQDTEGIDIIEFVEQHHPHIAIRVISGLPRRALRQLLPDMKVSSIAFKQLLLHDSPSYIEDFVHELQKEIDKKTVLRALPGPENTLWGNHPRQKTGTAGRLKQYYYSLSTDHPREFHQMWEEVDDFVKKVTKKEAKIDTNFPKNKKRNRIADMPLQMGLHYLKNLLINRLFWIKTLYNGHPEYPIDFSDYRSYFSNDFLLYSSNNKRFSQYASLCGFSINGTGDGQCHTVKFHRLLREEYNRMKSSRKVKVFDPLNSELIQVATEVLHKISDWKIPARFAGNYPSPDELHKCKDSDEALNMIRKMLLEIAAEKPSQQLRSFSETRQIIRERLEELTCSDEFRTYPDDLPSILQSAILNLNLPTG